MFLSVYLPVCRFAASTWLRFPRLFALLLTARIVSSFLDVTVPIASGRLVDAVAVTGPRELGSAFAALALFLGIVLAFWSLRNILWLCLNRLTANSMVLLIRDAFARCSVSPPIGMPMRSPGRRCARSRAAFGPSIRSPTYSPSAFCRPFSSSSA